MITYKLETGNETFEVTSAVLPRIGENVTLGGTIWTVHTVTHSLHQPFSDHDHLNTKDYPVVKVSYVSF